MLNQTDASSIRKRGLWARSAPATRTLAAALVIACLALGAAAGAGAAFATKTADHTPDLTTAALAGALLGLPAAALALALLSSIRSLLAISESLRASALDNPGPSMLRVKEHGDLESTAFNALIGAAANHDTTAAEHGSPDADTAQLVPACNALWLGIILIAPNGTIRYANGAARAAIAAAAAPAPDRRTTQEEIDPIGRQAAETTLPHPVTALLAPGAFLRGAVDHADELRTLRYTVRPLREHEGGGAVVAIEDITQRRAADRASHDFVSHAAHELRAPLTNIKLYIDEAADELATDTDRVRALGIINEQADRLERIVSDMLDLSEIEAASFSIAQGEARTETIIEETKAANTPLALDKDVGLTFDLPPKLPVLKGDRRKLFVAINNILGNAIKYTPEGGSVTVRAAVGERLFTLEVEDTGMGIPPADLDRIFDKFQRASDPRVAALTGSGLGLPLAREVARRHGGDLTVQSQIDQGSIFTLTLPLPTAFIETESTRTAA
ncbi:MAG: HAMP domain-containing sensor histidine kinase [Planctomycetota bacterium]